MFNLILTLRQLVAYENINCFMNRFAIRNWWNELHTAPLKSATLTRRLFWILLGAL